MDCEDQHDDHEPTQDDALCGVVEEGEAVDLGCVLGDAHCQQNMAGLAVAGWTSTDRIVDRVVN